MTRRRDTAATIDIVKVYGDAGDLRVFDSVQGILRRTMNITCLTLKFSFEPSLRVLPTAQVFNNLLYLNVNAPHTAVAQFLMNHPHITSLVVGACHATDCPLIDCQLPLLRELSCPPGCVQAVTSAASPLTQLTTKHDTGQDSNIQLSDLIYIPTSLTLANLHIEFDHTTRHLLHCISAAAPALHDLTLTESLFSVGVVVRHSICERVMV